MQTYGFGVSCRSSPFIEDFAVPNPRVLNPYMQRGSHRSMGGFGNTCSGVPLYRTWDCNVAMWCMLVLNEEMYNI